MFCYLRAFKEQTTDKSCPKTPLNIWNVEFVKMNQEINCIVKKIKRNRILVIGDVILDYSINGEISGLSAEAPIMTFREHDSRYALGGAANVALNLKYANQDVVLLSVVGADNNAETVKALLHEEDLLLDGIIIDSKRKTTIKKRFYTKHNQQIFRSDLEDLFDICGDIEEALISKISEYITSVDLVVLSDYSKGTLTRSLINKTVEIAHENGKKVVVDPKDSDFTKYAYCDILKPNKKELAAMVNKNSMSFEDIIVGSKVICEKNNHETIVVTLGEDGMFCCCNNGESFKLDANKVDCLDVSGAGDTAISYLAVGIASGMNLQESLVLANAAAGRKVTKKGAVPVNYIELLYPSKRIEIEQIGLLRQALTDKKIVFTNGCFDLLHAGHIYSLTKSKALGNVLVVGVNSDESVKRLKGETRPVIPLEERIQMLEALSCVDYIIPFDDDTPLEIIEALKPSILVKGSDYKDKIVVGTDIVKANGGEVKYIEMYKGLSTSDIVKRIKEN